MTLLLETERLVVRPYTPADLTALTGIIGDPQVFWWLPEPLNEAACRRWLLDEIREVETTNLGTWAVTLAEHGELIGGIGLKRREIEGGAEYELGYHLGRQWWGRGYATEAARAMSREARSRGLSRLTAFIHPDNSRSQAVALRLGMRPERRIQWAGMPHDLWAVDLDPNANEAGAAAPAGPVS